MAVFGVLVSQGFAYNLFSNNIPAADPSALPIVDNTGTAIALGSGYVAIGTFTSGSPNLLTIAADFNQVGTLAMGNTTSFSNSGGFAGFYEQAQEISIPQGTTGAPVGEQAYVVIGNSSSLATSTQFAVLSSGMTIGTEDQFGNGELSQTFSSANVDSVIVIGTKVENVDTGVAVFTNGVQLVAIPEPSTALLSLIGLGFIARRRR